MVEKKCVEISFNNNAVCINAPFFSGLIKDKSTYQKALQNISQLPLEHKQELKAGLVRRTKEKLTPIGYEEYIIFSALRDINKQDEI